MKELERDTMPKEVATELLTDRKARLTNRMRKNCRDARAKHFISDAERKPVAEKIAAKLKSRGLAWIGREISRAQRRRAGLQRRYTSLTGDNPVIAARRAAIDVLANHIDIFLDCAETEIESRRA